MTDKSNWQNHEDSPQRGSVTANVMTRRHGREKVVTNPHDGTDDTDDPTEGEAPEQRDEPDWSDPDIAGRFDPRHQP